MCSAHDAKPHDLHAEQMQGSLLEQGCLMTCTQSRSEADCTCATPWGGQLPGDLNMLGKNHAGPSLRIPLLDQDFMTTVPLSRTAAPEPNKSLLLHRKVMQNPSMT